MPKDELIETFCLYMKLSKERQEKNKDDFWLEHGYQQAIEDCLSKVADNYRDLIKEILQ